MGHIIRLVHFIKVGLFISICSGLGWYLAQYSHSQNHKSIPTVTVEDAIISNDIDFFTMGAKVENDSNLDMKEHICPKKCPPEYSL